MEPLIKELNKGQSHTLYIITSKRGQPLYKGQKEVCSLFGSSVDLVKLITEFWTFVDQTLDEMW